MIEKLKETEAKAKVLQIKLTESKKECKHFETSYNEALAELDRKIAADLVFTEEDKIVANQFLLPISRRKQEQESLSDSKRNFISVIEVTCISLL
jgi:hypothetical protein